jgi:hypothetical protein
MRGLLLGLLLALPLSVRAQDYPSTTMLYGTVDNDSLTVHCDPPNNGRMHCFFAQTSVSRVGNAEDFEKKLSEGIAQFLKEGEEKGFRETCRLMETLATAIRTGVPPKEADQAKFFDAMKNMPQGQKDDFLAMTDQFSAFCKTPNKQTAEVALRGIHDKEMRTCKIWTNTYEQTFTTSDFGKTWIANDGPSGECGMVVISKLERAKADFLGKDQTLFWTYHTRKIISNKDTKALATFPCSGFDEREFFYDWKGDEKFLGCDYVKFGF